MKASCGSPCTRAACVRTTFTATEACTTASTGLLPPTRAVSRPRTSSRPAYAFNYKPVQVAGVREIPSLISADKPNLVIETLKACEDSENAFIARVYEAEGGFTHGKLSLSFAPKAVELTNMLEETQEAPPGQRYPGTDLPALRNQDHQDFLLREPFPLANWEIPFSKPSAPYLPRQVRGRFLCLPAVSKGFTFSWKSSIIG